MAKVKSLRIERKKKKVKKVRAKRPRVKIAKLNKTLRKLRRMAKIEMKAAVKKSSLAKVPAKLYKKLDKELANSIPIEIIQKAVIAAVNGSLKTEA